MKSFAFGAGAALAAAAMAAPAGAVSILNNGAQLTAADVGLGFTVNTDGSTANSDGLFGKITFKLTSVAAVGGGTQFKFDYTIENRSVSPAPNSRLGQFGFDVSGTPGTGLTVTNEAGNYFILPNNNNGNFNGLGNREVCLTAGTGNNCSGGANDGILSGLVNSRAGKLIFTYAAATQSITFSNFATRWQAGQNGSSASGGGVVTAVPEPATWAMMVGGFGLLGAAMRRRRVAAAFA